MKRLWLDSLFLKKVKAVKGCGFSSIHNAFAFAENASPMPSWTCGLDYQIVSIGDIGCPYSLVSSMLEALVQVFLQDQ